MQRHPILLSVLWSVGSLVAVRAQEAPVAPATETAEERHAKWDEMAKLYETYAPVPKNTFSLSLRYVGEANVTFSNLGTIERESEMGAMTDLLDRVYTDGYVSTDQRTTGAGSAYAPDGATNTWGYTDAGQVTADGQGITFTSLSSTASDSTVEAKSGKAIGIDLEYARSIFRGARDPETNRYSLEFGWVVGWGMNSFNASSRQTITADLNILKDTYSLLGADAPVLVDPDDSDDTETYSYDSPSSETVEVVNADGTVSNYIVDTTTLLGSTPYERTENTLEGEAEVDGFWQVKGAYFTLRTGPFARWAPTEHIAIRAGVGASVTWIGVKMRYAERLRIDENTTTSEITETSDMDSYGVGGLFGGLDAEWWLTKRTGFFGGAYYESFDKELNMELGGRSADVQISSGLGLRFGISTRF